MILDSTTRSLLRLLAYYVVLVAGTFVLAQHSAVVRDAVSFEVPLGVTPRQLRQSVETGAVAEERAAVAATTALAMLGVLALGLVVSGIFNVAVVALWSFNVGDIYAGEPRPHLTGELRSAEPDRAEGILLVRATPAAQAIVEATLQELTKTWKPAGAPLTYVVRLKKKTTKPAR